ncbi:MAG: hypothetical protein V3V93_00030 [bacterium]
MRRYFIAAILSFLLAMSALTAPATGQVISEATTPEQYRNIEEAIAFLKEMGETREAINVRVWLENGAIYQGPANSDAETTLKGYIYLPRGMVRNPVRSQPRNSVDANRFRRDDEDDFQQLLHLVITLVHEKVHAHQNRFFKMASNVEYALGGSHDAEIEAWGIEVTMVDRWIADYLDRILDLVQAGPGNETEYLRLLREILHLVTVKLSSISQFRGSEYGTLGGGAASEENIELLEELEEILNDYIEEVRRGETPPEGRKSAADKVRNKYSKIEETLEPALRQVLDKHRLVRDDALLASASGLNRRSGDVIRMTLTNKTSHPIKVPVRMGTVLRPGKGSSQSVILGENGAVVVPPRKTVNVTLRGYSIESWKAPPPEGSAYVLLDSGTHGFNPRFVSLFPFEKILKAGRRLADSNAFGRKGDDYRDIVLQWALWARASEDKEVPHSRETFARFLATQDDPLAAKTLKTLAPEAPARTLPDKEIQDLSGFLWTDVEQTLAAAKNEAFPTGWPARIPSNLNRERTPGTDTLRRMKERMKSVYGPRRTKRQVPIVTETPETRDKAREEKEKRLKEALKFAPKPKAEPHPLGGSPAAPGPAPIEAPVETEERREEPLQGLPTEEPRRETLPAIPPKRPLRKEMPAK